MNQIDYMVEQRRLGRSTVEIADELGIGKTTVARYVQGIPLPKKQCFQCGKEYQPKTPRSNFCSRSCQIEFKRSKSQ